MLKIILSTYYIKNKKTLSKENVFLVGEKGLEPSRLAAPAPKAGVSTNSTTRPLGTSLAYLCMQGNSAAPFTSRQKRLFNVSSRML
jgi:hypothetical protein